MASDDIVAGNRRGLGEDLKPVLRALGSARKDGGRAAFAEALFRRGASEDMARYTPDDLAGLASRAFDHLGRRPADRAAVEVRNPDTGDGELARVTVIEIVNDNMPFLVDSVMGELAERGLEVRLVLHPIVLVRRDGRGRLTDYLGEADGEDADGVVRESLIHVHVDRIDGEAARADLAAALEGVLADVRGTVDDWPAMLARLEEAVAGYKNAPPPLPVAELAEAIQFLEWLKDDNFTFLGVREYRYSGGRQRARLSRLPESGLGILRDPERKVLRRGKEMVAYTPEIRAFLEEKQALIITKASMRSRVHRRVHMDYVGVKLFGKDGALSGELRLIGLFTSTAYTRSARSIPILRRKVAGIVEHAGFDPVSHSGKALINVLETYPRDELFQVDGDTLYRFAMAILQLDERPRIRVLARADQFDRFVSLIVFVPRERYTTHAQEAIGAFLAETYDGRVSAVYPDVSRGPLARMHFIIGRYSGQTPRPDQETLEAGVAEIVTTWADRLRLAARERTPAVRAESMEAYADAFDAGYRDTFAPETALDDIARMETLGPDKPIAIHFARREDESNSTILKLYHRGRPLPLSERVPLLENMGLCSVAERTFRLTPGEGAVFLHEMALERLDGGAIDLDRQGEPLAESFLAIWSGAAENDGYNALTLTAGLAWGDIAVLRAFSRYLRQIRVPFSQDYMWQTLTRHGAIAADIAALFRARLEPGRKGGPRQAERLLAEIEEKLAQVDSLDEDRIVRRFVNAVESCLRTNVFQSRADGEKPRELAFKLDSRTLEGMPAPAPLVEIFVYSPQVEGVHLRFGKVARGGIRWSDRPQDFRTEVLGLVKAQQVKNAVIVPVGSKGGFVPKTRPAEPGREAAFAHGKAAYEAFIGALLDVTDDIEGKDIRPPEEVVRRDGDDPYLVVAADKGTATFSDTANAIAEARGFWLGDAFASGGSAGYDHKVMGITARGGWEAVKRHFREMNVDIQATPFTAVGVGDMSGDVFGNAMLLSRAIKLVAAFDHRHIFIDPDPDPAKSFAERERLFKLARSSWDDYDKRLISKGGGVFERSQKAIRPTPEMRALLDIAKTSVTPAELMGAILKADADLLWFGGIGTYVRGPGESDEAVGDRANDAIRVDADGLRVRVVGEGANLGVTQRGRVAFAMRGGRINTDAIDNSAGVNSSDYEVNIKVALAPEERAGRLKRPARNRLLASMTEEVAGLVLRNNYQQTLAISLAEQRGLEDLGFARRLMQVLEERGALDRALENLPSDTELAERAKRDEALTRPEIAVLLAYAKIVLFDDLLDSDVPDDAYLSRELQRYFPDAMKTRHSKAIERHRLRREIIATMLANSIVNRGGPTMLVRIGDQTGAPPARIASAFAAVRDAFGLTALNGEVDALDGRVDGPLQLRLYGELQDLLLGQIVWFLRRAPLDKGLSKLVERYGKGIERFAGALGEVLPQARRKARAERRAELKEAGVPDALAGRLADLDHLTMAPDVVRVAEQAKTELERAAGVFFAVGEAFELDAIGRTLSACEVGDYYDRLALDRMGERLETVQRRLTMEALATGQNGGDAVEAWTAGRGADVARSRAMVREIVEDPVPTIAKLAVGTSLLADLAGE